MSHMILRKQNKIFIMYVLINLINHGNILYQSECEDFLMKSAILVNSRFITEVKTNNKPQTPPRLITVLSGSDTAQSFTRSTTTKPEFYCLNSKRRLLSLTGMVYSTVHSGRITVKKAATLRHKVTIGSGRSKLNPTKTKREREIAVWRRLGGGGGGTGGGRGSPLDIKLSPSSGALALKGLSRPRLEILNWHLFTTFDLEDEEDDWYRQLRQLQLSSLYMIHGDDGRSSRECSLSTIVVQYCTSEHFLGPEKDFYKTKRYFNRINNTYTALHSSNTWLVNNIWT